MKGAQFLMVFVSAFRDSIYQSNPSSGKAGICRAACFIYGSGGE